MEAARSRCLTTGRGGRLFTERPRPSLRLEEFHYPEASLNLVGVSLRLALLKPWRIPDLVGMAWAFRARDWYRRAPFIPFPPEEYMRWRMDTAYGNPDAVPPPEEFERFVVWAARMRRIARRGGAA